jgi:3-(3-hydroxy-phenyl)propionate hydroxylase
LASVLDSTLPAAVLDTYEQERKPHARAMIRLALSIGRCMTSGGRVADLLRRLVSSVLCRVPAVGGRVLDGETPALRRSALVHRSSRARRQLAGTLCPNPVVAASTRLDAALGLGFAIVTTTAPDHAQSAVIAAHGAVLHFAAANSELAQWLRRGRATAALIRPDRTVMRASGTLDALCTYLKSGSGATASLRPWNLAPTRSSAPCRGPIRHA